MTKDKALDLALEALELLTDTEQTYDALDLGDKAITAIKQARSAPVQTNCRHCGGSDNVLCAGQCKQALALDKKAENARELGLDYEPADGTQVSKVWWDGEKLMAKPIPLVDFYQPMQDSACSETLRAQGKAYPRTCRKCGKGPCIGAPTPPAAPVQKPDHSDELTIAYMSGVHRGKELAAAQAVPDAFGTREGEHPQYIQGWNDCRAEMLSMRKRVKP
jgi:hypothetical protein